MPDYQFMFVVRGINQQKAGAISQRIEQRLTEDAIDVTSVNTSRITVQFRVVSVDMETREVFDETVEALNREDAYAKVESATRVVAMVNGGRA